jgi:hypothetical protein
VCYDKVGCWYGEEDSAVGSVNLACPPLLPLQCLLYTARFCDGLGRPVQLAADMPCGLLHITQFGDGENGAGGVDGWDTPGWRYGV